MLPLRRRRLHQGHMYRRRHLKANSCPPTPKRAASSSSSKEKERRNCNVYLSAECVSGVTPMSPCFFSGWATSRFLRLRPQKCSSHWDHPQLSSLKNGGLFSASVSFLLLLLSPQNAAQTINLGAEGAGPAKLQCTRTTIGELVFKDLRASKILFDFMVSRGPWRCKRRYSPYDTNVQASFVVSCALFLNFSLLFAMGQRGLTRNVFNVCLF